MVNPVLYITISDVQSTVTALGILFGVLSFIVLSLTWLERKALGRLQRRLGPTRSGPFVLLQPIADAVKLVLKEDILPSASDKAIFWIAPVIVVVSAFMVWVTIPITETIGIQNLELGLLYITAVSVFGILGLVLAGWGSANKYGVIGGLRSAAQLISYEIPIIMVVVAVGMLSQSLDLRVIVDDQNPLIYGLILPLGLVIFFISGLAEVGRTPFDIYHAESEISGGPFVEYSGAHWSVFFLAEYINTFAIATMITIFFLGGLLGPVLPGIVWFLIKVYGIVLVVFCVRGTFPRLRIDQLMAFAWKVMVPLAFYTIVITAIYLFYNQPPWTLTCMSLLCLLVVSYFIYQRVKGPARRVEEIRARQAEQKRNRNVNDGARI